MRLLLRLYPAAWRERYEEEFLAVLEQRPLSPFDVVDIALAALDARLRPGSLAIDAGGRRSEIMNPRIGGMAAIAGGGIALLMLTVGFLLPDSGAQIIGWLYPVAAVALLLAFVGLSAVQGRRNPALTWAAVALPVAGIVVAAIGWIAGALGTTDTTVIGDVSSWTLLTIGTVSVIAGSVLFGLATAIVHVFSRRAALTLFGGSALLIALGLPVGMGLIEGEAGSPIALAILAGALAFCIGWVWLGIAALADQGQTRAA